MIELKNDCLIFSFPDVHPDARIEIDFKRTLRIPDDGKMYPLPPGLGRFPMQHVDDHPRVPEIWKRHGGVMMPMYQSEALWVRFSSAYSDEHGAYYPFAIKIATGRINAVSGESWSDGLHRDRNQDYVVVPGQPWLDGYNVARGEIRQFVAMPLGDGYSAEEQLTGHAEHGGLQVEVFPMKRMAFQKRFPKRPPRTASCAFLPSHTCCELAVASAPDMGLAPGGRMRQEIYEDPFNASEWAEKMSSRCFVHLCNSLAWQSITGKLPPHVPFTAAIYEEYGLPWFDYYDDSAKVTKHSSILAGLKSIVHLGKEKGTNPLPENESVDPKNVKILKHQRAKDQVREGW